MSNSISVLIADDSAFTRKMLVKKLGDTEFNIIAQASTGIEAVDMFKDCHADLVLLDVIMPDMDGSEALKNIIELDGNAKVMMLSSFGAEDMVTKCLSVGAKTFVQKPFDKDTLLANMRTVASS